LGKSASADLSLTGFREDELKRLLRRLDARERRQRVETFDLEAAIAQASSLQRVQAGELWALNEHRVLVGDAAVAADVRRLLGGSKYRLYRSAL
jgi:hypothetical protein